MACLNAAHREAWEISQKRNRGGGLGCGNLQRRAGGGASTNCWGMGPPTKVHHVGGVSVKVPEGGGWQLWDKGKDL